ncbi:MAG: hypothetical protein JXA16_12490 [Bacteroidales bacterium]|nr:hypothetical protein [Bacteroidales bacterium]
MLYQCSNSNDGPVAPPIDTNIYGKVVVQYQSNRIVELTSIEDGMDTSIYPFNAANDSITIKYRKPDGTTFVFHNIFSIYDYSKFPTFFTMYPDLMDTLILTSANIITSVVNGDTILTEKRKYSVQLAVFDSLNLTKHGTSYRIKTFKAESLKLDTSFVVFVKQGLNIWSRWP